MKNILNAIGNTPLVEIKRLNPNPNVQILAKIEYVNPGGSIKDRPALYMIEEAEKKGLLTPDKIVIEATSGNTGIGLAMVCAIKGYRLLLAMSEMASQERQRILKARGTEILLTPGRLGTDGAIEEVYRIVRENPGKYFAVDQFNNPDNWRSHYYGTAMEIWEQTNHKVIRVVATMGTTGTLMGISKRLKELNPNIQIIGVEPYLGHKIQGLKNLKEAYCPEIYEKTAFDAKVNIEDEQAFEMTRRLAKEEGLFVGMSSGAAMAIAIEEAKKMIEGVLVVIFPDSGERYLSTSVFSVKEVDDIHFVNSLTRTKEDFAPIIPGKVSIYSCGPTVNDRLRLFNFRRFIFADVLCRYLKFRDYAVTHVVNITDFDDKTIQGAEQAEEPLKEFTGRYLTLFQEDLKKLRVEPATVYPRASEHLTDMITLTQQLIDKQVAYEKLKSVYFNIGHAKDYGHLSGVDLDKIRLGATIDLDEYEKDNPRDFTLLRRAKLSDLKRGTYVETPWGNVRPSWHIQCVAMAMKELGETFDIHTSSRDLIFPHHENEMAIAKILTGKSLANYWLHCDRILVDEEKHPALDRSLTLPEIEEMGYSAREVRMWLIQSHYRKPITFSPERLLAARKALERLDACVMQLQRVEKGPDCEVLDQILYDIHYGFAKAMDDDLNVSKALAGIFKVIRQLNRILLKNGINPEGAQKVLAAFKRVNSVLEVFEFDPPEVSNEIKELLGKRALARKKGCFQEADEIREILRARGIQIHDDKR